MALGSLTASGHHVPGDPTCPGRGPCTPRGHAPWGAVCHRGPLCPGGPCTLGSPSVLGSCVCWGDPCALGDCVSWGVHVPWRRVHRHWGPVCPAVSTHLGDPGGIPLTAGAQAPLPIPVRGAGIPIRPTSLAWPRGRCFAMGRAMGPIGIIKGTIKCDAVPAPRQSLAPEGAQAGWGTRDPSDHHVPLAGVDAWSRSAAKEPFTAS